jgi:hypothetical protein
MDDNNHIDFNARPPRLVPPKASGSFVTETFLPTPSVHSQEVNLEIDAPVFHGSSPDDRLLSISKG